MADDPKKPDLTLLPGAAFKTVDDVAAFFERVTGRTMTDAERKYAAEKLAAGGA